MLKRTLTCGDPRVEHVEQIVILNGWVNRRRDHGGLIFVDLRDRYGLTQVVFDPQSGEKIMTLARKLGLEDVIAVRGKIRRRPENAINREMATGAVELLAIELMKDKKDEDLTDQLTRFWTELRDNIDDITIEDPANPTGNDFVLFRISGACRYSDAIRRLPSDLSVAGVALCAGSV